MTEQNRESLNKMLKDCEAKLKHCRDELKSALPQQLTWCLMQLMAKFYLKVGRSDLGSALDALPLDHQSGITKKIVASINEARLEAAHPGIIAPEKESPALVFAQLARLIPRLEELVGQQLVSDMLVMLNFLRSEQ